MVGGLWGGHLWRCISLVNIFNMIAPWVITLLLASFILKKQQKVKQINAKVFHSFRKFLFRICHWKLLHHHLRQQQWRSLWFVLLHSCWWELFRVRKLTYGKWGNCNCNRVLQTRLSSYKLRPIKHKESHFFLGWTNPIGNFRSIMKIRVVIFVLHF